MVGAAGALDATLGRRNHLLQVSPARLASSTPLRLDHNGSTGFNSGA